MKLPFLRTISARITVGFAVLILTFGTVSALTVRRMGVLSREMKVIQVGYWALALKARDLSEKQRTMRQYLDGDLVSERTPGRVVSRLRRFRLTRDKLVDELDAILATLTDLPRAHRRRMGQTKLRVDDLRTHIAMTAPRYDTLLATPPIERRTDTTGEVARAREALDELVMKHELIIQSKTRALADEVETFFDDTARLLGHNAQRQRLYTITLGLIAMLLGLLMTVWATLTLRPLRRLADGAQRVARGDYASRIDESGPTEVAELAHEFNIMGRAVEERERELVRSERLVAVGKMASMITHEVRNPLSSIGLNTELLEEELAGLPAERTGEARTLCAAINTEVDRLAAITEEYLQFARLPKPKVHAEDLGRIVSNLVEFEREQLALRGVAIEVAVAGDLPAVMVDDSQLRQCLLNLLRNAAEAVEENGGGQVTIAARLGSDQASLEVSVHDDGRGVDAETAVKLFDPFFSTKTGGTGLGLALTHQIVREHGGEIRLDSKAGEGATFVVSLPIATVTPIAD
jgi:two-component system NtrC family sensor kinase